MCIYIYSHTYMFVYIYGNWNPGNGGRVVNRERQQSCKIHQVRRGFHKIRKTELTILISSD